MSANKPEEKQTKLSQEQSTLNEYQIQQSKKGLLEVELMLKQPYSLEQAKEQTESFMAEK